MLSLKGLPKLQNRKLASIKIDEYRGGVNTLFSDTRLKRNEAKEATNLMLIEDGVWDKRWGTAQYGGVTWTATPDGFSEYRKTDGTRELIVVADGKVWEVDPSASTKTEITGATFTSGYPCDFIQIQDQLFIGNGFDSTARYNGTTLSTYSGISAPASPTLSRGGGLSAGGFTYYYRIAASNDVGITTASAATSVTVNKDRDIWTGTDNYIDVSWSSVTGADKYTVYFGDTEGYEVKLAEVNATSYRDDGSAVPNPYIEPSPSNTTTGPKVGSLVISGNRIYGTRDLTNAYRVYATGTGANLGNWSPAYGGFWVDLEKGGRNTTVKVIDFQGKAHVIMESADGKGSIWQISVESQQIADTSFIVPIPTKVLGATGGNSLRGIVAVENDYFIANDRGMMVFGNEPGILNQLRANDLTSPIRNYWQGLHQDSLDQISAYYIDAKVLISVPTSDGAPNRTVVYDRERRAWIKDWTIGVSQFGEYTDTNGDTKLLGISGNKLIEFSENYQGDSGVAFTWKYISPKLSVSDNWTQFAKIKRVYIRLRNAQGNIDFAVTGTGKTSSSTNLGTGTIAQTNSNTGMGWDVMGSVQIGSTMGTPTSFANESTIKYLNVNKLIRDIQFTVSGDALNDRAVIIGLQAEGFVIPTSKPSDWKL